MGGVCIFPRGWASAFPPFGRLSIANAWRAAGSWPSSACVDPCGDLSLLLQRELPASQSVSAEGVTRRSAPGQVCGLALQTRLTCPHFDGRPPTAVGRVSSPRGVAHTLVPRKIPQGFFLIRLVYIYMSIGIDVRNPLPTIGILALQGRVYADFVFQVSKTSLNPNSNWNCRKHYKC